MCIKETSQLGRRFFYAHKHNILRKRIEGYWNSFDYITFGNIIFKQSKFVSERTITMQFTKLQNEIYGSLVTIQYHTKCTYPLYSKFTCNTFSVNLFCCNLNQVIAYVLIPTTDKCSHPTFSVIVPKIGQLLKQKCTDMAHPGKFDHTLAVKHWQQLQN